MIKHIVAKAVREFYGRVAKGEGTCCASSTPCCGSADLATDIGRKMGYGDADLESAPDGSNLGLGCGNPVAAASLQEGETVLDLGSGAGLDCFLAAQHVGVGGKVIGVDMTPEMVERARENAKDGGYRNVEFRLGEIEHLPVADSSVDVVISNCVINLSVDKLKVSREAFRVLKPGGRVMVSDLALLGELPDGIKNFMEAYVGCVAGALPKDRYLDTIRQAGFYGVEACDEVALPAELAGSDPAAEKIIEKTGITAEELKKALGLVVSMKAKGRKPQ